MAENKTPIFEKINEFFHRLKTKITLAFKGKNAVFTIEIDLTQAIAPQLHGIEHTLANAIPTEQLTDYLKTVKKSA